MIVIGETPFSTAYGAKAMSHVELGLSSPCHLQSNEIFNDEFRRYELDFSMKDEQILNKISCLPTKKVTRYYNSMVKKKSFFCKRP